MSRRAGRGRLLLVAATLGVLLAAGEIAGRLLERYAGYLPRRTVDSFIAPNPFVRTALVPGARFRSGTFEIDVNSLGFRGEEISAAKPPGTFRIFALGESTTFGWKGVRTHREAWPALLESKLRAAYPTRAIEVVNAGVPGWTSVQQRVNFMLRIAKLAPDAILVYHGNNDLLFSWVPDVETKTLYGVQPPPPGDTWWNRLLEHSYVYMDLRLRKQIFERSLLEKHHEPDPAALRMLRQTLAGLVRDASAIHAKVAIATFPHALDEQGAPGVFNAEERALGVPGADRFLHHLSPQGVRRSFPVYNAMVRELTAAEGLPLCDLAPAIPKTTEYFIDWCHLSAKGEETVAQHWFETIRDAGWLR
jgi:lysophospholipase L1-like esterase